MCSLYGIICAPYMVLYVLLIWYYMCSLYGIICAPYMVLYVLLIYVSYMCSLYMFLICALCICFLYVLFVYVSYMCSLYMLLMNYFFLSNSAILAAGAPEVAPFMADEVVQATMGRVEYTLKAYLEYSATMISLARKLNQGDTNYY